MAADVDPVFAVATIKLSKPDTPGKRIEVLPGDRRLQARNYSLVDLMTWAYGIHPRQISGAPAWIETERYDIDAEPEQDGAASEKQWRTMLSKLLTDRFKLTFHSEDKELSVYAIAIGKLTPKLTPSTGDPNGLYLLGFPGPGTLNGRNANIKDLAGTLQRSVLDRPVIDRTGLAGRYDFILDWRPDEFRFASSGGTAPEPSPNDSRPDLFTAMQQQLGLKLESTKATVEVLVVDHVEHPSQN